MNYVVEPSCQIGIIDQLYRQVFGYKTNGIFVEVGAFDGQTHSNTSFLADLGWRGVYVEPVREYATRCRIRHAGNSVSVLPYAVTNRFGVVTLSDAGELSTTIDNPKDLYTRVGLDYLYARENRNRSEKAISVTLDAILESEEIAPRFDLLVIDTESTELAVLQGFTLSHYQPTMIIVEMHEASAQWESVPEVKETNRRIHAYIKRHSYRSLYADDINSIFVRPQASTVPEVAA